MYLSIRPVFRVDLLLLFFPCFLLCHSLWLNACLPRPLAVTNSPGPAPVEQCQAVQQLVSVCSGLAQPSPARVLIPRVVRGPRSELILQHRKTL